MYSKAVFPLTSCCDYLLKLVFGDLLLLFKPNRRLGCIINDLWCWNETGKHLRRICHMKLIYLLCQKISLSQTIFSRGFRIKYNLGGEKKKKNPCSTNSNHFKKKPEASFSLAYWQCLTKVIGTAVNNVSVFWNAFFLQVSRIWLMRIKWKRSAKVKQRSSKGLLVFDSGFHGIFLPCITFLW